MDKSILEELNRLDTGGVLAYTSLISKLENCGDDTNKRSEIMLSKLPNALLCALQNEECLQDIKNVAGKYPDLLPIIFSCAMGLRDNKSLKEWMKYESSNYKDFIADIGNKLKKEGII